MNTDSQRFPSRNPSTQNVSIPHPKSAEGFHLHPVKRNPDSKALSGLSFCPAWKAGRVEWNVVK